jgi:hypothetical protein
MSAGHYFLGKAKRTGGLLGLVLLMFSCKNSDSEQPYVPNVPVNVRVILSNSSSAGLNVFPNYIYVNGGVKGIILTKNRVSGEYTALDRCCTFRVNEPCEKVSMHSSGLYLTDSCCRSQFDFEGNVTIGPASKPLRYYNLQVVGNELLIQN